MAKPEDHRRVWRTSKLPTRPAPVHIKKSTTPKRLQVKHEAVQSDRSTAANSIPRLPVPRSLIDCAPTMHPARPGLSSHDEANPSPSAPRKRGADAVSSDSTPAHKRPAHKRSKSDFASAKVGVAQRANKNEVLFSSLTGQEGSQPASQMTEHASYVIKSPASKTGKQKLVWGVDLFQSKYDRNTTSASKPVTPVPAARLHTEPTDIKDHVTHRKLKVSLGRRQSGTECEACGSPQHMTKDCHNPENGTVAICPIHNCSTRDMADPDFHHLDGLVGFHHSWCPFVMSYERAVIAKDSERIRYMLPQMFGEFVLNRRRKPFCRIVNLEVCPIHIAIEFSREFCRGRMPSGLEKAWPYTKSDTGRPDICQKLSHYDELGWEGMPPGELEAKPWDQIKREYAQGIIPPQIHMFRNGKARRFQKASLNLAAAEIASERASQHDATAQAAVQTTDDSNDDKDSTEEEVAAKSCTENDLLLATLQLLSAKVDSVIERLGGSEGRQRAGEPTIKSESKAYGTRSDPIDIDSDEGTIHWRV